MQSISPFTSPSVRRVHPEQLDGLSPEDPRARRSRRDLERIHRVMGSRSILVRAISRLDIQVPPRRILELGAGDGTLLLRLLGAFRTSWRGGKLTLVDQHDLVNAATRARLAALGWTLEVLCTDVLDWARSAAYEHYDFCLTTLFLHHFRTPALAELLAAVAARADALVACEPRRNAFSRLGSQLLPLLGVNEVTHHDAVTSVAAGFAARELSAVWSPSGGAWRVEEYFAAPFTHCFVARRCRVPSPVTP